MGDDMVKDGFSSVRSKYKDITLKLIALGKTISTMESCTAGQIVSLLTDTEGSSLVVLGSLVTYSNEIKVLGGVESSVISRFGVYSKETASAMAQSIRSRLGSDIGVGVTGSFANKDPNNPDSVPGEVFFAISTSEETQVFRITVPSLGSRFEYKMHVADVIADRLLDIL